MEHFYQSIPGWFDYADLYDAIVARAPSSSPSHVVEVGTFLGKSAAYLAVEIANSGKPIQFDTIDLFAGIERERYSDPAGYEFQEQLRREHGSLEAACRANLAPVADVVTVSAADTFAAVERYADASLDFVWLDDCHDSDHVYREMRAWWPKVKPGGILAGHDFDSPPVAMAVGSWAVSTGNTYHAVSTRAWQVVKPVPFEPGIWTVPRKRRKCLVAVCCNERQVYPETARSLIALGWGERVTAAARQHEFADIQFGWFHRYLTVPDLRDEAVLTALQLEASHILFLDADMMWPSDLLSRMLAHHHRGVVSGLYFLKRWPHSPVAFTNPRYNRIDQQVDYDYDLAAPGTTALRREQMVGFGCTLVPVELFRRLERPWFRYQTNRDGMQVITEDVWFCQQATAVGCPIWLDPTIVCQHLGVQRIDEAWFHRAQVERQMLERALATSEVA